MRMSRLTRFVAAVALAAVPFTAGAWSGATRSATATPCPRAPGAQLGLPGACCCEHTDASNVSGF